MLRLSANHAGDLHGGPSPFRPSRLTLASPPLLLPLNLSPACACGAGVVRGGGGGGGGGDRENHASRRRDEIDSRRDAGECSRERRSTRHDWQKRNEGDGGGSSRRVIERCARHYRSPWQKVLDPGTRSREYVPRRAPEVRPRTTKCLVEGNFEKLNR